MADGSVTDFQVSDHIGERAVELVEQRRVLPIPDQPYGFLVMGDLQVYTVWFHENGVDCSCYAGSGDEWRPRCAHAVAAMLVVAEGHPYQHAPRRAPGAYGPSPPAEERAEGFRRPGAGGSLRAAVEGRRGPGAE